MWVVGSVEKGLNGSGEFGVSGEVCLSNCRRQCRKGRYMEHSVKCNGGREVRN